MPETRYRRQIAIDGTELEPIPYEVSDEQLADEAEAKEVKLIIEQLPDKGINKAWRRLLEKGILP